MKKLKWTWIDTLLVIVVVIGAVAVYKVFGGAKPAGDSKTITAEVLIAAEEKSVADAIKVGDEITVSLTEKDSGVLKDVKVEPAKTLVYNSIDGAYEKQELDKKVDIYATIELNVTETELCYSTGSMQIKVGEKLPFRSKGYALEGYVIGIGDE